MCSNLNILNKYLTDVGFGNAIDQQGRGYSVRLFISKQKGDIEKATSRISASTGPKRGN